MTQNEKLINDAKLRIRQLFLDDSKCELCEKVTSEDGYDGNNEGCEKGLCIECAIHKSLVELSTAIRKAERERVCNVLITKLDACISSCPSDARQKPKTILKRCKETIESLRSEP